MQNSFKILSLIYFIALGYSPDEEPFNSDDKKKQIQQAAQQEWSSGFWRMDGRQGNHLGPEDTMPLEAELYMDLDLNVIQPTDDVTNNQANKKAPSALDDID